MHLNAESNITKIWPQKVLQIIGNEYLNICIGHKILYFPELNRMGIIMNKIKIKTWKKKNIYITDMNIFLSLLKKRIIWKELIIPETFCNKFSFCQIGKNYYYIYILIINNNIKFF